MLTYAIGDVHGCLDKLLRLLDLCDRHRGSRAARYIFLGDYIDRGHDSCGTVSALMNLQRDRPKEVVCLCGNHEQMMLSAAAFGGEESLLWQMQGGAQTLESYGRKFAHELPIEHHAWISSLPMWFDDGRRYFVHAGVNPSVALDQQAPDDLLWIREPFLSSTNDYGRLIVHGHTPLESGVPELRSNRLNLDTAAVFGGPLSAALFDENQTNPILFLNDLGEEHVPAVPSP